MATSEAPARARRHAAALQACVLHQYDWSETSLIVELFTREQGRLVVAAKGAKRPTSQLRGVLLPFQPLLAQLGRAPADEHVEVLNLRGAEWAGGQPLLPPAALFGGYYVNELLLKLLARNDPHPALYDAYTDTLGALAGAAGASAAESAALRAFELALLRALGLLPELAGTTLTAEPLQPDRRYALHAESGLVADADHGLSGTTWVALEAALMHAFGSGQLAPLRQACGHSTTTLRAQLRPLLHYHLGHARLRTRQVWQGVQRLAETALPVRESA